MPFTNGNDYTTGRKPVPTPSGMEAFAVRFTLAVTTGDLALNTIGLIGYLPPSCVPVDVYVDMTDIDSGAAAVVFDVGILDAAGTALSSASADGGGKWGSTTAVNTAAYQRLTPSLNAMALVTPSEVERKIGVKVATAPTTPVAGTIGVTVICRP